MLLVGGASAEQSFGLWPAKPRRRHIVVVVVSAREREPQADVRKQKLNRDAVSDATASILTWLCVYVLRVSAAVHWRCDSLRVPVVVVVCVYSPTTTLFTHPNSLTSPPSLNNSLWLTFWVSLLCVCVYQTAIYLLKLLAS